MRVLIVEDDPLIAADLSQTVEGLGHEVCGCAASADEARAMADQTQPEILLVDFNLEGTKTGLSAAAHIRASRPTKVVFITGQFDPLVHEAIGDARPDAVLGKPYTAEQVRAALAGL
jgi:CheY-like chemotaxis protein